MFSRAAQPSSNTGCMAGHIKARERLTIAIQKQSPTHKLRQLGEVGVHSTGETILGHEQLAILNCR